MKDCEKDGGVDPRWVFVSRRDACWRIGVWKNIAACPVGNNNTAIG